MSAIPESHDTDRCSSEKVLLVPLLNILPLVTHAAIKNINQKVRLSAWNQRRATCFSYVAPNRKREAQISQRGTWCL